MSDRPKDVLLVGARTEGEAGGWSVLRQRDEKIELGEIRPLREGKPIEGDIIKLSSRPEHERLFDVEVLAELPSRGPRASGPAQVATDAYRDGWELAFGRGEGSDLN